MNKTKLIGLIAFCIVVIGCKVFFLQTFPRTDYQQGENLLNVHLKTAKEIKPEISDSNQTGEARYLFLSDMHRGYGEKNDRFKINKKDYNELLKIFFNADDDYTLILNGDVYEGWGFQKNNISIIHKYQEETGKKDANEPFYEDEFKKKQRFYGIYGNHDDYLRGNPIEIEYTKEEKIRIEYYPSIMIKTPDKKCIFVTHGCQGHGLHDAGDELAAWGVFVKYNGLTLVTIKDILNLLIFNIKAGDLDEEDFWQFYMYHHLYSLTNIKKIPKKVTINKNPMDKKTKDEDNKNKISKKDLYELLDNAKTLDKGFCLQEKNILQWTKDKPITDLILGHTHNAVFKSKMINYEKKFQKEKLKSTFTETKVDTSFYSLLGDKVNYHNTGMACNKEIPFLFLKNDEFHFFYMKRIGDAYKFIEIIIDNEGKEKTDELTKDEFISKFELTPKKKTI